MLEYRLELLYPIVDYFVLSESTLTYKGNPKPLFYQENAERYSKYADKIIHIIDRDLIPNATHEYNGKMNDEVWQNENHQRNYIKHGLDSLNLDESSDYILISDLDEIINPIILQKLIQSPNQIQPYMSFAMDFYNLTCKNQYPWFAAKLVNYGVYKNHFKEDANICRLNQSKYIIPNGGWHLSYFGDVKYIKNKLENFSHQEFNKPEYTNESIIEMRMKSGIDLFGRSHEQWINIDISNNTNLPPNWEKLQIK
jgi:beta-1,4-mannosyl-glycoprotein beta-1,4-N-acetylglucosaminyltransferase